MSSDNSLLFKDGRSALHYAALYSREDVVKLLLNKKPDTTLLGGVSALSQEDYCSYSSGVLSVRLVYNGDKMSLISILIMISFFILYTKV